VKTALGAVRLWRCHGYCRSCGQPEFAADRVLGVDGWLTPRARRMACLAGVQAPFRQGERLLSELAGWSIDAETLRRHCHAEAARARAGRGERGGLPGQFRQAPGERELQVDAGKVNTPDGWRDVKVAAFACRQRGKPATADDYQQRELPAPAARAVVAAVEEAQAFGRRCAAEAERLGLSAADLSVLGDGAEWIWNLAQERFSGAAQLLDIYHGVEHLAEAARQALAEGPERERWLDAARRRLIGDGYLGVCEALAEPLPDAASQQRLSAVAGEVLNYFCGHQGRLGYAARLRRGQAIGSGLVEGTIKQRVNLRMKRSGARWLPEHVGPFVEFLALADGPEWSEFWASMAA
jgi:hypothetical protein